VLSVFGRRIKGMIRLRPEEVWTCNVVTVWTGLVAALRIKSWLRGNVTGFFGALSVFGRRITGMIRFRPEQVWTCNVYRDSVDATRDRVTYQKLVTR
jgi:hypothetical protein